jgi:hypothetical protein
VTINTHLNRCGWGLYREGHNNKGDAIADGRNEEFDKAGGKRVEDDDEGG